MPKLKTYPHPTPAPAPTGPSYRPEFFSLPAKGPDPICGMSRGWWYSAEKAGHIKLTRIRTLGRIKPRLLVSTAAAIDCVNRLAAASATDAQATTTEGSK